MAWLWSKLTLRRQVEGEEARAGAARLPARRLRAAARAAARSDRGARRAGADRPPGAADRAPRTAASRSRRRARTRSARGHDPREFDAGGEPERYDAVVATVPSDVFAQLLDAELARAARPGYLGAARAHRVPHRALPAARARPPLLAASTGPTSPTRAAVHRPDRADEPRSSPSATAAAASSTSPTTSSPATRCSPRPRRAARRATSPACGRSTRRSSRDWIQRALAVPRARRAADRDRRLPRADPAARHRRARPRARQHDADLSRGPRHELQRPAGGPGRRGADALERELERALDELIEADAGGLGGLRQQRRLGQARGWRSPRAPSGSPLLRRASGRRGRSPGSRAARRSRARAPATAPATSSGSSARADEVGAADLVARLEVVEVLVARHGLDDRQRLGPAAPARSSRPRGRGPSTWRSSSTVSS